MDSVKADGMEEYYVEVTEWKSTTFRVMARSGFHARLRSCRSFRSFCFSRERGRGVVILAPLFYGEKPRKLISDAEGVSNFLRGRLLALNS